MDELQEERYQAALTALAECVRKNVSMKSVKQLAFECGIDGQTVAQLYRRQLEAA